MKIAGYRNHGDTEDSEEAQRRVSKKPQRLRRDLRLGHDRNEHVLTAVSTAKYSSPGMRKRALCLIIVTALLSGAVGVGAHDDSWAANMPLCCKTARSNDDAPQVSMARLCCKLNCSEPGSGGSSNASNLSRNQGSTSPSAIIPTPTHFSRFAVSSLTAATNSHQSKPKYIQHLALLI